MHTPSIMSYANSTEADNRRYADRWGYGFHVVDHVIDHTRVPHWSKLHAVQMYLPEYDFLLWIDADAVFFDHSLRIEDVMDVAHNPETNLWAQEIWPDYPSISRNEVIDTGIVLFRNKLWTRQFLTEMYYHPSCQEHLNWTEQYCFSVVYHEDFLNMRQHMRIHPTPLINHHIVPPSNHTRKLFILHLAGRPNKARAQHFKQVHEGRAATYETQTYADFWRFWKLFARQSFAGIASLQACLFGIGDRHRAFLDALLFHFPYLATFTVVKMGAPRLWSQMKATEEVGERYPERMAHLDVQEYMSGITRDGEKFVEGMYCDMFILGVESWRHLPSLDILGWLSRSGLEPYHGNKNEGFGFSPLLDSYFVWLFDGCDGGQGAATAAAGESEPMPKDGMHLDDNDEDGSGLVAACELLGESRSYAQSSLVNARETSIPAAQTQSAAGAYEPVLWSVKAAGVHGIESLEGVSLARIPRAAFLAQHRS